MQFLLLAAVMTVVPSKGENISGERFEQVMRSLHGAMDDVFFIYEGEELFSGDAGLKDAELISDGVRFQGAFAYRSDGSRYSNIYLTNLRTGSIENKISAMLNWNQEEITRLSDIKISPHFVRKGSGSYDAMSSGLHTPLAMFYHWYFMFTHDYKKYNYRQVGFEKTDDRDCLVVEIDRTENAPPNFHPWDRFYIDLKRGGHPLKIERFFNDNLHTRVHSIRLQEFPSKQRGSVWIPVACELDVYEWQTVFHKKPVQHSSINIVDGSVLVDQNLPDQQFTLQASYESPKYQPLARARREFNLA